MNAPRRLLEDDSVALQLRTDLETAQSLSNGRYDARAGLLTLLQRIEAGGAVAGSTSKLGLKLILGAGALAGVVYALWPAEQQSPSHSAQPISRVAPAPEEEKLKATPVERVPEEKPVERVEEKGSEQPPMAKNKAPVVSPSPSPDPDELARRELEHLKRVRIAAATDPVSAVSMAQAGHQEFARGILYEEREGLLILSLAKVGRTAEAKRRAKNFSERFPRSPLLPKMNSLLREEP